MKIIEYPRMRHMPSRHDLVANSWGDSIREYPDPIGDEAYDAIKAGDWNRVQRIIDSGYDIALYRRMHSQVPLYRLFFETEGASLLLLLKNVKPYDIDTISSAPNLLAESAVYNARIDVLEILFKEWDVDPNMLNSKGLPLIWGSIRKSYYGPQKEYEAMIVCMMRHGARLDGKYNGLPIVHHHINASCPEDFLQALLDAGADARALDDQGRTALEFTQSLTTPVFLKDEKISILKRHEEMLLSRVGRYTKPARRRKM